jgi:hypothetical protein
VEEYPRPAPDVLTRKQSGKETAIFIRSPKDFFAGILFLSFGGIATWVARDYPMGSALRMGPGYFPTILGGLMLVLGVATFVRGLAFKGEPMESVRVRPLFLILAAVGLFAATIEAAGIIVATLATVAVATAASTDSRPREVVVLLIVMLALAVGVFTYALGLPFKLMPG